MNSGALLSTLCAFMFTGSVFIVQNLDKIKDVSIPIPKEKPYTKPVIEYVVDISDKDLHCLEQVVWHEARGEPKTGQIAVAQVVLNRVGSDNYPNTVCGVVYQNAQFTDIDRAPRYTVSEETKRIVYNTVQGKYKWIVANATMYYSPEGMKLYGKTKPSWDFTKLTYLGRLHNHKFYAEG